MTLAQVPFDEGRGDPSPDGMAEIEALMRAVFATAHHLDRHYLEWAYVRNPDGAVVAWNAYGVDGKLVGHCACQPMRARVFGEVVRGLLVVNLAVLPEHRRGGLIGRLARRCFQAGIRDGYRFVCGAGNRNSTRTFIRTLDFRMVRPLEARFGLAPLPRAQGSRELDFERLWSSEALAWRLAPPRRPYSVRRRGPLATVYAPAGHLGTSLEVATLPSADVPSSLPSFRSLNPLRLWIGLDPNRRWSRSLTVDLPERWRPSPLNWLFFDLRGEGRAPRPEATRLLAIDFDAF